MSVGERIGTITVTRTVREVITVLDSDFSDFNWREEEPNEADMQRVEAYRSGIRQEDVEFDFQRDEA